MVNIHRRDAREIYFEKLNDAAQINKLTGASGFVATHILWDYSTDGYTLSMEEVEKVSNYTHELGLKLGSISPTYFLKGSHRGSLSSIDESTRSRYIDQTIAASEIAEKYGNQLLTLWLPDGSSYPGQVDLEKIAWQFEEISRENFRACQQGSKSSY